LLTAVAGLKLILTIIYANHRLLPYFQNSRFCKVSNPQTLLTGCLVDKRMQIQFSRFSFPSLSDHIEKISTLDSNYADNNMLESKGEKQLLPL